MVEIVLLGWGDVGYFEYQKIDHVQSGPSYV